MNTSYMGLMEQVATFTAASGVTAGMPVKLSANGTVSACAAGDGFIGVCVGVRGGYAAVQLQGYVTVPYTTSTAPTVGFCKLSADGAGGVKADTSGRELRVLDVNTTDTECGILL